MYAWSEIFKRRVKIPLDPDLERNLRRTRRAHVEMAGNERDAQPEERNAHQRSMKITKMQELGTWSKYELMTWISLHHSRNCLHLL